MSRKQPIPLFHYEVCITVLVYLVVGAYFTQYLGQSDQHSVPQNIATCELCEETLFIQLLYCEICVRLKTQHTFTAAGAKVNPQTYLLPQGPNTIVDLSKSQFQSNQQNKQSFVDFVVLLVSKIVMNDDADTLIVKTTNFNSLSKFHERPSYQL